MITVQQYIITVKCNGFSVMRTLVAYGDTPLSGGLRDCVYHLYYLRMSSSRGYRCINKSFSLPDRSEVC